MKKTLSLVLMVMSAAIAYAQPEITFEEERHDFGDLTEGPKAIYDFKFTNTGDAPLVLQNVRASCGCTTPQWPREPIAPGETAVIKAIYNTKGRPGNFRKTITVTSNAEEPTKRVYINGQVLPDPNKEMPNKPSAPATKNVVPLPELELKESSHSFGKMELNQPLEKVFTVKNTGEKDMIIKSVYSRCNCTSFTATPKTIAPGREGQIKITYRPNKLGQQEENVYIVVNAPYKDSNKIILKSNVVATLQEKSVVKQNGSFFGN